MCLVNGNETYQRFVDTLWRKEAGRGSSSRSLPFARRRRRRSCSRRGGDDRLRVALRDAVPALTAPTSKHSAGTTLRARPDAASRFAAGPAENRLTYPPPELRTSSPRPELFISSRDAVLHSFATPRTFACAFASVRSHQSRLPVAPTTSARSSSHRFRKN